MELKKVKDAVKVAFASNVTLCLVGESGTGKTTVWGQLFKELRFDSYIIIRPAMIADAADLVGLPDFEVIEQGGKKVKTTDFMRPKWLPNVGEKTLIVVDEINRVTKDVANAFFGLIEAENPTVGQYNLPEGCKVVATCNPPTDSYGMVLDISDSAWSSRLCFVKIAPSLTEFTDYGRKSGAISDVMLDFLNKNEKFYGNGGSFEVDDFFGSSDKEKGDHIRNNNRSKKKISDLYVKGTEMGLDKGTLQELIRGIGGNEFSIAFMQHAMSYNKIVTLEQLLDDVKSHDKFDFTALSNVSKIIEDLKFSFEKGKIKKKNLVNIVEFIKKIPSDTLQGFLYWIGENANNEKMKHLSELATKAAADTDIQKSVASIVQARLDSNKTESNDETK